VGALKELEETAKLGDEAAWRSLLDRLPNANAIFHLNVPHPPFFLVFDLPVPPLKSPFSFRSFPTTTT
jgi:hypothetical protein